MSENKTAWRVVQARSAGLIASIFLAAAGLVHAQVLNSPSAYTTPPHESVAEAQRRLNDAHRRRAREAAQNAQNAALLLSAAQAAPAAPARTFHRRVHMLRHTTPLGRRAVQPPAPVPAAPPAAAP